MRVPFWLLLFTFLFCAPALAGTFPPVVQGNFTDYSTAALGSSSATQVIGANYSRKYLVIQNPGSVNIACGPTSAVTVGGVTSVILTQYGSWSFSGNYVYNGAVWCIAASGSNNTLVVLEGN